MKFYITSDKLQSFITHLQSNRVNLQSLDPEELHDQYMIFLRTNESETIKELYYLQNGWIGNSLAWWRIGSAGYTTDLREAERYTKEQALNQIANNRSGECAWPCNYVDSMVEAQRLTIVEGRLDASMILTSPKPEKS